MLSIQVICFLHLDSSHFGVVSHYTLLNYVALLLRQNDGSALKEMVHPKIEVLTSFFHPRVIPNPFDIIL